MKEADVRCAGLDCQSAVAVPAAELLPPRDLGTLHLRADLAESQSRLDAQPHKVGGSYPDRLWDSNRAGLVRQTRRAEGQLHARVRERVADQFLRGQES
ncbi:hypothetical protein [Streptomyces sp. YU58]|uniref:hypothetical protein n=1 Tax=Streptomyces sp. SX92 TaxID=3158972 RepID=UPI0027B9FB24|nr:hypothetical protein [Streptomyces coralus]WLW53073.1 hypothetical protein QU709_17530 [Streptomyces coralus]